MNFDFTVFSFDSASLAVVFILISPSEKVKDEPDSFNSVKYTQIQPDNIMSIKRETGALLEIASQLEKEKKPNGNCSSFVLLIR